MNPEAFDRGRLLARLRETREWDLAVIGGGATGLGVALDAAARGLSVVLLESEDFAKGTSSRATKLVHGGVRYLAQGDIGLVHEALHERTTLLANAPQVAQRLAFVVPAYRLYELPFYGAGLKAYDVLAGRRSLGPTEVLSARRTQELLPTVRRQGLVGGIKYWDGQFDDARLALLLARSAIERGAVVLNHVAVTGLMREGGKVRGLHARDAESGEGFTLRAGCVVNAAGVWVDAVRDMDREAGAPAKPAMVAPSQGVHLVVDRAFLPGTHALMASTPAIPEQRQPGVPLHPSATQPARTEARPDRPPRSMNAHTASAIAAAASSPTKPPRRGSIDFGARPAATSAATATPASPSPATSPDAARMPGSLRPSGSGPRPRSTSARTQPPT